MDDDPHGVEVVDVENKAPVTLVLGGRAQRREVGPGLGAGVRDLHPQRLPGRITGDAVKLPVPVSPTPRPRRCPPGGTSILPLNVTGLTGSDVNPADTLRSLTDICIPRFIARERFRCLGVA